MILPRYTPENMIGTPARSSFRGYLTRETAANAARFLERDQTSHITREDFDGMCEHQKTLSTHAQELQAILSAITTRQRLLAVIYEEAVEKQAVHKKSFWPNLKAQELKDEIKLLSPFLASRTKAPSTMVRKVAWVREWIAVLRQPLRDRVCEFLQNETEKNEFLFLFAFVTSRKESRIYALAAERKGSSL